MNRSRLTRTFGVLGAAVLACGVWAGCAGKNNQSAQSHGAPIHADIATAPGFWGEWPKEADPKTQGRKVVENLLTRTVIETRDYGMIYPEVCTSYGSVRFVGATGDKALLEQLLTRYQGMLNPPGGRAVVGGGRAGGAGGAGRAGGRRGQAAGGATTAPTTQAVARGGAAPATQGGAEAGRGNRGRGGGGGAPATPQGIDPKTATALTLVPPADHVDRSVFGTLPLEIYRQTNDARYLMIGVKSASDQWATIDTTRMNEATRTVAVDAMAHGLTPQTRWWIDDMFMVQAVQVNAYRATKDRAFLDRAARIMAAYLDKLQKENGLFYHADDVPAFWGRGCGWVAVGMAELLQDLPADHPQYARIMEGYTKMMAGLLKYQGKDGMWHQLIDQPESWAETSSTGMFTFALGMGVKKGWLPAAEYKEPVRKAWIALCGYLNEDGRVRDVCVGTNKYPNMANAPEGMVAYYNNSRRAVGDLHGQAGFIWASWAMLD